MSSSGWKIDHYGSGADHRSSVPPVARRSICECAADIFGTSTEVRQSAAGDVARNAESVVDDLDGEVVVDLDVDSQRGGVGMPGGVANSFSHNRFRMIGQAGIDNRQRADELDPGAQLRAGELANSLVQPLPQPRCARFGTVQVEDRGADLLDDFLQIVHAVRETSLHFGRPRPRDRALQRQPDREEPLDDVVVKVARDPVTVGQDVEFAHPTLRSGELPGQRGLVGERSHHLELFGAERVFAFVPDATTTPATVSPARRGSTSAGPVPVPTPTPTLSYLRGVPSRRPGQPAIRATEIGASTPEAVTAPAVATTHKFDDVGGRQTDVGRNGHHVASAPVNFSASSATSRNMVAGSAPDSISVAMSRVASIHDCRARTARRGARCRSRYRPLPRALRPVFRRLR